MTESPPGRAAAILGRHDHPGQSVRDEVRQWRQHRGLSQLTLAGRVGSTCRHISFLETGRSRPSRQMVLRLAETLDVGRREANDLLHAAGLPASYPIAPLDSADLAPYRAVIDLMLAAHEPYPGMVLDGHWTVTAANAPCQALFGPSVVGSNFVRDSLTNPTAAGAIANWPEVVWAGLDRLRLYQRRNPFDPELRELVALAEAALADVPRPPRLRRTRWWCVPGSASVTRSSVPSRWSPGSTIPLTSLWMSCESN